jgi:hypothetical protein
MGSESLDPRTWKPAACAHRTKGESVNDRLRVDELLAEKLNLLALREALAAEFAAVRREEREACAKLADKMGYSQSYEYNYGCEEVAAAIRAMNEGGSK